ncbi:hypothetical protein GCM10010401_01790 [Rarobacter faecitabidus]|uniref:DivIVA domain-containing protein n=1 Tax=Rarobacter faecitabidus TaxID=13243 RepID=A0A542ZWQ8_RARFA|nr:DivIVA domain-containing protein [Rarobacter faecitabidus]TQL64686.1 DivIVA domain-containing protein [Rarobacter faecitabidus]
MTTAFPRSNWFRFGYDPEEVDDFFDLARASYEGDPAARLSVDEIQSVAFDQVHRGYKCDRVDAALDRLAAAMVVKERAQIVEALGQQDWNQQLAQRATTLYSRLTRPERERFAPPRGRRGYDAAQVDALLDRLTAFFDEGTPITAREVQQATFKRRGPKKGYDEASVDAYLRRAGQVLLAAV